MTVHELIEDLSELNPNAEVIVPVARGVSFPVQSVSRLAIDLKTGEHYETVEITAIPVGLMKGSEWEDNLTKWIEKYEKPDLTK